MQYFSTRNNEIKINSSKAVLVGLAKDGGLYIPDSIPAWLPTEDEFLKFSYDDIAAKIISLLLPDYSLEECKEIVKEGYGNKFDSECRVQLSHAGGASFLELYHGPTSAFKDMALCILPGLLSSAIKKDGSNDEILILTATSGDTGKAALAGFSDIKGVSIAVFYPEGGVSDIQRLQMATQEGSNVHVCSINGNFDEAQTGVKKAFASANPKGFSLCSANSINIGRLVPQVAYYFWAYAKLLNDGKIQYGDKVNFAVPTGNFGDILAGYIAKEMGLPVSRLLCASNINNVLTDFLKTGEYDKRRDFHLSASPSMDILVSSNLERLLYLKSMPYFEDPGKYVSGLMESLAGEGHYKVDDRVLKDIQKDFDACFATEEECFAAIDYLWKSEHYLIDTHTAIAYACVEKMAYVEPTVVLSTASPFKFSDAVLTAIGETPAEDCFQSLAKLEKLSGVKAPDNLSGLKEKVIRHKDNIDPKDIIKYVNSLEK